MKGLCWLLLATPCAAQTQIVADSLLMRHLERIADTATVETARCLAGDTHGDTLIVAGILETPWLMGPQTDSTVLFAWWNCPHTTVAVWHNHIAAWALRRYPRAPACYLGGGDVTILSRAVAPPIAIVSVRTGLSCVFVRLKDGRIGAVRMDR